MAEKPPLSSFVRTPEKKPLRSFENPQIPREAQPVPKVPGVGEAIIPALEKTAETVVGSGAKVAGSIASAAMHPVKTISAIGETLAGGITELPEVKKFYDRPSNANNPKLAESRAMFNTVLKSLKDRYGSFKAIGNTIVTDPVGFLVDLSVVLEGGGTLLKTAGEAGDVAKLSEAGRIAAKAGETVDPIRGLTKLTGKGVDLLKGAPETEQSLAGKITQATKPGEVASSVETLKAVDLSKAKTYEEAGATIQKSITKDLKNVDKELAKYPEKFKPADLEKSFKPESGGRASKINYVSEAIDNLKQLYKSTKDPKSLAEITDLERRFKSGGLTSKEINDLSRKYGTEFGEKAFSKRTGEPLTSVNAQAYENVRKGLKENARGILPNDRAKALDEAVSAKIETKELMDDMTRKVKALQNKLERVGPIKKAASAAGKAVDIVTGKALSKFWRGLMDYKTSRTLNAVELQSQLQRNIRLLDKLDQMDPAAARDLIEKISKTATGVYYGGSIDQATQSTSQ